MQIKQKRMIVTIFLIFFINFISLVHATSIIVDNQANGLRMTFVPFETIKRYNPYNLTIEVINESNGVGITTANCTFKIINHTGEIVLYENLTKISNHHYNLFVKSGNFTKVDQYGYVISCASSVENTGNAVQGVFSVTNTGTKLIDGEDKIYNLLFFGFLIMFALMLTVAILTPFSNPTMFDKKGNLFVIRINYYKYVKIIASWVCFGLYMILLTLLTGLTQNYVQFAELKSMMTNIYTYSYILSYGVTVAILSILFILIWKDIIFNKEIIKSGKAFIRNISNGR